MMSIHVNPCRMSRAFEGTEMKRKTSCEGCGAEKVSGEMEMATQDSHRAQE